MFINTAGVKEVLFAQDVIWTSIQHFLSVMDIRWTSKQRYVLVGELCVDKYSTSWLEHKEKVDLNSQCFAKYRMFVFYPRKLENMSIRAFSLT